MADDQQLSTEIILALTCKKCNRISKKSKRRLGKRMVVKAKGSRPGGEGRYSEFQVTGMIEWGQKSKPKKIPRASNKPKKIPGPKINPK